MAEKQERSGTALVIGVGHYAHTTIPTLPCARYDAQAVARLLIDPQVCQFSRDQVKLLTNEQATRDALVSAMSRWLPGAAREADIVFLFFAGHGMVGRMGHREEGYLLPFDADPDDLITRGIAMRDVAQWIEGIEARAVVVCLDCCHAGKALPRAGDPVPSTRNMGLRPSVLPLLVGEGRILIASCAEGEYSLEVPEWGHGLFTYHLLRGLEGAADLDGNGRVGVAELFEYVSAQVARDSREKFGLSQSPWKSSTDSGGVYLSTLRSEGEARMGNGDTTNQQRARLTGTVDGLAELERLAASAEEEELFDVLRMLQEKAEPASAPLLFRLLAHPVEEVRRRAKAVLQVIGWPAAAAAAIHCARREDPTRHAWLLDGLTALEAHVQGVALLDHLIPLFKSDLRNRAILLLERKQLALALEETAALFREHQSSYSLVRVLGQGSYTAAYLARHEDADLDVVVRVLLPEYVSQPRIRASFIDLGKRAAKLVHQNLVRTLDTRALPVQRLYYVVRDYVDAPTLQRLRDQGRPFAVAEVLDVIQAVLEALSPAHRQNLPHGGVKPANIFLFPDGRVILGDPSLPPQGTGDRARLAYDYRYAAPETFRNHGLPGPPADLYGLGCVAYELLCGAPPFVSDNPFELAGMHVRDAMTPPSDRNGKVGREGDTLILRLLAKEPEGRFQSLAEAAATVERWRASLSEKSAGPSDPVSPPPVSRPSKPPRYATLNSIVPAEDSLQKEGSPPPKYESTQPPSGPVSPDLPRTIGRYQVTRVLGEGAFGVVYLAHDPQLARDVAIKLLRRDALASKKVVERFSREAKVTAQMLHPNIVPVYDVGEHQGSYFIASAYIQGHTLSQAIGEADFDPVRAVRLVLQLLEALSYAHEHGILHRDIKPANIMLEAKDQLYLMDFGLARLVGENEGRLTQIGAVMGTPSYMPPEQARGDVENVGPAADQYGAGLVLYELLTGHLPFEGMPVQVLLHNVLNTTPRPPSQWKTDLDRKLEALCLRALAKQPEKRFASCRAFSDALRAWLTSQATSSKGKGRRKAPSTVPSPAGAGNQRRRTSPSNQPSSDPGVAPPPASMSSNKPRRGPRFWVTLMMVVALVILGLATILTVLALLSRTPQGTATSGLGFDNLGRIRAFPTSMSRVISPLAGSR